MKRPPRPYPYDAARSSYWWWFGYTLQVATSNFLDKQLIVDFIEQCYLALLKLLEVVLVLVVVMLWPVVLPISALVTMIRYRHRWSKLPPERKEQERLKALAR